MRWGDFLMTKNLILCGFMGSGKTSVGTALAKTLSKEFIDLDKYIEKNEGLTVSEIFARFGEEHFRNLETKAATCLGSESGRVISLGGGTVLRSENIPPLKQNGIIFYLDVNADTVLNRLKYDTTRPLLKNNKEQVVYDLINTRAPIYKAAADYTVDSNGSVDDAVNQILNIINSL